MAKHKNKIIIGVIVVAVLAISFFVLNNEEGAGRDVPGQSSATVPAIESVIISPGAEQNNAQRNSVNSDGDISSASAGEPANNVVSQTEGTGSMREEQNSPGQNTNGQITPELSVQGQSDVSGDNLQGGQLEPAQPPEQPPVASPAPETPSPEGQTPETPAPDNQYQGGLSQTDDPDRELTVTLVIRCATILDNLDKLPASKAELVPPGGVIFSDTVVFYEDESVFNVLQRETRKNRIHMEFANSPIYNSAYIEGINNIYEFECGEGSGWMYSVNGYFPNYGSSRYALQDGDTVLWEYTCDRGADIGGGDAADSYSFGG